MRRWMACREVAKRLTPVPPAGCTRTVRGRDLGKVLLEIAGDELTVLGRDAKARQGAREIRWPGVVASHLPSNCRSRPSTMTMKLW